MTDDPALAQFTQLRPRLFGVAYRMLASRSEADDVLQDAWLRWHAQDKSVLHSAEAWLVTVVTRLCIDRLRQLQQERQHYVGHWLPEPLVGLAEPAPEIDLFGAARLAPSPEALLEQQSDVSFAYLLLLERLKPEERAAFLLREVFDNDYPDIAAILQKSEASCRQLVHRARERLARQEADGVARTAVRATSSPVTRETHALLLEKFMQAVQSGQREAMLGLLAEDARLIGDGGGKVASFPQPLAGGERISWLYYANVRRFAQRIAYRAAWINGSPGLLRYVDGALESAQVLESDGLRIHAIYVVRNPDKLAAIAQQNTAP
ncbi:RNA polymerase sigma factor SigJ [Herbaspirillum sp.]|jgi:RNA polymerase sigma factor (sigma-70 family)|uniref:RNA polymerase sigma factor SigJ n=1 Tax=Herbaspirillum TaxID=963 RepID=UPI0025899887|nr:RNA polymerase sigma factor SigJ [Herbaspirillum sp.]MCP3654404.1 sigma-70 family RNA polymerase sigma factor [Herbaspirillum sp.]MCP3946685.1 sigma-70 family RNA polymerase sigma factor [Herbaspirillum sp.]MCP4031533.1 sigma-70 family RNA polymerase sigma factor [Herbaspirillum sp.]MCP4555993.1 sigma-70 family RNA polymerase sigma factor [Herbaspirillum sp.]